MSLLREVLTALLGMVVAEAFLSSASLAVVGVAAALLDIAHAAPLLGGGVLVIGCPAVLIASVRAAARRTTRGR